MSKEWRWRDRFLSACVAWVPGTALVVLAFWLIGHDGWRIFAGVVGIMGLSIIGGGFSIYRDRTHPDDDPDRDEP